MSGNASADTLTVPVSAPETGANTSPTGDGFLTGVTPAKSPDQIRAEQQAANQPPAAQPPAATQTIGERLFTATEVETFRQQEKDKVYGRIDTMAKELEELRNEREAERLAREEAERAAEAAAKAAAEEGTDVRDLLRETRESFEQELRSVREEAERAQALLEKERELQALTTYRQQAIQAHADRLVPEIVDFIGGDTPEQIDASIQDALTRSERIVQGALAAQQQQLQGMRGTRTTAPSGNGPLEEQQEQRQITAEQIKNLSPSEYAAMRGTLQQAGRAQFYGQR